MRYLLYKASAAYPDQIELSAETIQVWFERLASFDFRTALSNLDHHIDSNDFFPTIAAIKGANREQSTNYDQLRLETAERFAELERWKREAVPLPEHLIPKSLRSGGDSDA